MKNKIIALVIATMTLSLVGCGNKDVPTSNPVDTEKETVIESESQMNDNTETQEVLESEMIEDGSMETELMEENVSETLNEVIEEENANESVNNNTVSNDNNATSDKSNDKTPVANNSNIIKLQIACGISIKYTSQNHKNTKNVENAYCL